MPRAFSVELQRATERMTSIADRVRSLRSETAPPQCRRASPSLRNRGRTLWRMSCQRRKPKQIPNQKDDALDAGTVLH
jgi:hypothetical protein